MVNNIEVLPTELSEAKEELKNTSFDDENKCYMTESNLHVINFNKVKENYLKNNKLNINPTPRSNDALYVSKNGKNWAFIEFKNGKINNEVNFEINKKIYDSLAILFDLKFPESSDFENSISYTREHMDYILVYNIEKYDDKKQTRLTRDGKKRQNQFLQNSNSRNFIGKSFMNLAGEHFILFGLDQFKGYFFKDVFTFTQDEFEKEFVKKYSL